MKCFVYRSSRRADTYLFVPGEDDFSGVPEDLRRVFGTPELALSFDLTPGRRLAAVDADEVIRGLRTQGYFLQMPPGDRRSS